MKSSARMASWFVAAVFSAGALAQSVQYRTIVLSGQPAPGLTGVTFDSISDVKVTPGGTVAFWATLTGAGVTTNNDSSIWTDRGGTLALAYREGVPAFGTTGTLAGIAGVDLNENGLLAFAGSVFESATPNAPENVAYFSESAPGVMNLVVREPAATQNLSTLIPFNASGKIAWSVGSSILSSSGDAVTATTPVPNVPGVAFRRFSEPAVGDSGALVFRASFGADAVTAHWGYGVFTTRPGSLSLLAQTGGTVPNLPTGTTWIEFGASPVLGPGDISIDWGRVGGGGFVVGRDTGLFREQGGALVPIVVAGNPVPQVPGATFATFSQRVAATSDGGVVFLAYFDGATANVDNGGIFVAEPGQPMRLLARRGHTLVGMPTNSVIGHLGEPRVGGGNVVAFTAFLTGPGVAQTQNYALFAGDTRLSPSLILRVGDTFNIPGGATQTIRSIMFDHESVETGRSDIAGRTLAVRLTFEDRSSGLFTATLPCSADFDGDGDVATDADIEAFFACLAGNCCATCGSADFDNNGDVATDADIEAFFRVLAGGSC